jgi:Asp/Glu/hydantoin racemase
VEPGKRLNGGAIVLGCARLCSARERAAKNLSPILDIM